MERCLAIPEIVLEVLYHLDGDKAGRKTLTRMATLSKAMHELAVRVIWDELPGLGPLCRLFPNGTFTPLDPTGLMRLNRNFKLSQLEQGSYRVKKYAQHVRILRYEVLSEDASTTMQRIDWTSLLRLLKHPNFPRPIFPNLVTATLPCFEPKETMLYATLVLSQTVRSVKVLTDYCVGSTGAVERWGACWRTLSERLDSFSINITSLRVESMQEEGVMPIELAHSAGQLYQQLTSLKTLSTPAGLLPGNSLQAGTSLQRLEVTIDALHTPAQDVDIPNITHLHLSVTNINNCNRFLHFLRAQKLEHLTIHYSQSIRDQRIDLKIAFEALLDGSQFPHLSSISVDKANAPAPFRIIPLASDLPTNFPISLDVLRPLLSCQSLTSLRIPNVSRLDIGDRGLLELLSAWPKLRVLKLECTSPPSDVPALTLAGLHTALLQCPSLTSLDLPCDARALPAPESSPHPALTHWNVRSSPLESSREAAATITHCFPTLKDIQFFDDLCANIARDPRGIDDGAVFAVVHWTDVRMRVYQNS